MNTLVVDTSTIKQKLMSTLWMQKISTKYGHFTAHQTVFRISVIVYKTMIVRRLSASVTLARYILNVVKWDFVL